jgi:hypothetical protein
MKFWNFVLWPLFGTGDRYNFLIMGDACVPDFITEISKGIQRYCAQLHTCAAELVEHFLRLICWFSIMFFLEITSIIDIKIVDRDTAGCWSHLTLPLDQASFWANIYSKHMQTLANHHKPTCLSNTITIKSKNSSTIFISIKSKSQPPVKRVHFSPLST